MTVCVCVLISLVAGTEGEHITQRCMYHYQSYLSHFVGNDLIVTGNVCVASAVIGGRSTKMLSG